MVMVIQSLSITIVHSIKYLFTSHPEDGELNKDMSHTDQPRAYNNNKKMLTPSGYYSLKECNRLQDQVLLVWGNPFLVLNLCLDIVDGIRQFHLQHNCLSCERINKDLHASA